MYSWNTIRTLAAVLLLLPIAHLAYLLSSEVEASLNSSPQVWSDEVEAYAQADLVTSLPSDPLVVVGTRQVTLWRGLQDFLDPVPVLLRGLGNATVNDITYHYERLIGHYGPRALAILPGTSEFQLRDNKSPRELTAAIQELALLTLSHEKTRFVYVFPPLKTPRYLADRATIDRTTEQLEAWALEHEQVRIVDGNRLLSDRYGQPRAFYFHSDGTSLNEHGFGRLGLLLRDAVERDHPRLFGAR